MNVSSLFSSAVAILTAVSAMPAAADLYRPAVASNGDGFLVAWQESTSTGSSVIRARQVSANGALLGNTIIVCDSSVNSLRGCTNVRVGYAGGSYLVTWSHAHGYVNGQLINATTGGLAPDCGTWSRHDGTRFVCSWNSAHGTPAIIETLRGNFLVVANQGADLYGYEMTPAGMNYAHGYIAEGEEGTEPAIAHAEAEGGYFIAVRHTRGVDRDAVGLWWIGLDPPFLTEGTDPYIYWDLSDTVTGLSTCRRTDIDIASVVENYGWGPESVPLVTWVNGADCLEHQTV